MYDPTVFENLKVAFENHVYDLDNLDGEIVILDRSDLMDFSVLGRRFSIQFVLAGKTEVKAEVRLEAALEDLAGEILEWPGSMPGCSLLLRFAKEIMKEEQCLDIKNVLAGIWEGDVQITQTLSREYEQERPGFLNRIEVGFGKKLNEENMGEIRSFLETVLKSLEELNNI